MGLVCPGIFRAPIKKDNFDGAINPFKQSAGVGGIVRDHIGEMKIAYSWAIRTAHPLESELQALLQELKTTSYDVKLYVLYVSIVLRILNCWNYELMAYIITENLVFALRLNDIFH